MQILIQSNKQDLSTHIKKIEKHINKKENKNIRKLANNYINYIKEINYSKKTSSKIFYLIISNNSKTINSINSNQIIINDLKEKYFKIKECLSRCDNSVTEVSEKKEILNILNSFLNTRKYLNSLN